MEILQYSDLDNSRVRDAFDKVVTHLRAGDFRAAGAKKLTGTPFYRAKLNDRDRLLFRFGRHRDRAILLLLEIIHNHEYEKSRFLNGARIDDEKLEPAFPDPEMEARQDHAVRLSYVNPQMPRFHLLDKILSFDDAQDQVLRLRPPLILIGSAGSGKTALMLEKLKMMSGEVLYVTLSPFLVENARNLYYANRYENERVEVSFLSYRELLETIRVPGGRELTFREFAQWFARHRQAAGIKDAHKLFEEIRGVLTGWDVSRPHLPRDEYLALGVRQSIFLNQDRAEAYRLFEKYLSFLEDAGLYDTNLVSWQYSKRVAPAFDSVAIDEVQDFTNIQVHLALRTLRGRDDFILGGDANQIVHPNFFSWAHVKSLFYRERAEERREVIRVLHTNYRNSPEVTEIANRLLLIKNVRFGSIDRESNYLVRCISENKGEVVFLAAQPETLRELNEKTRRSARFAVIVLRQEDKEAARGHFKTPLLFSIHEAKGLEYENIILFNLVSSSADDFEEIIEGVTSADLSGELEYSRAKDKSDKSVEAYKFFINALYVAATRAVRNLYLIERDPRHRLFDLLGLKRTSERVRMAAQESSREEWEREARRLELQGKQEQAELIRKEMLGNQPVPWRVLTPSSVDELKQEALDPEHYNRQAKLLLFEYAAVLSLRSLLDDLVRLKFNRAAALSPSDVAAIQRKYRQEYLERGYPNLKRKLQLYGIDFRNPLNQTPLMIAAEMGLVDLVRALRKGGANPDLRDNWGRTPFQIALRQAYLDSAFARDRIGPLYELLAPSSLKVKVEDRLIKLDRHHMEFFLLHSMLAVFQDILRHKIEWDLPAFETADFVFALEHFPDPVIAGKRRTRQYISAVLARNEVLRANPYNRRLFVRIQRGFYIPNPLLEIDIGDRWARLYELIHLDALEQEKDDELLQKFIRHVRSVEKALRNRKVESVSAGAESG